MADLVVYTGTIGLIDEEVFVRVAFEAHLAREIILSIGHLEELDTQNSDYTNAIDSNN